MRSTALRELLGAGPAALDGGLATELQARGHDLSGELWSARLLRDEPAAVRDVHAAYFAAGATVGTSASYQASRSGFERQGSTHAEADRLLALSVTLVREARDVATEAGRVGPMLVAASVGPYGATLHDGSEYRGRYGVPHERLVAFHRERLDVLVAAGPDLLAVETVPDLDEAAAIVEALRDYDVPAWLSFSCADDATTCAGQPIEAAAALVAAAPTVEAVGINCTRPEHVGGLVARIRAAQPDLPGRRLPQRRSGVGRRRLGVARRGHRPAAPVRRRRVVRRRRLPGRRLLRTGTRGDRRHRRRRVVPVLSRAGRDPAWHRGRTCVVASLLWRRGRASGVASLPAPRVGERVACLPGARVAQRGCVPAWCRAGEPGREPAWRHAGEPGREPAGAAGGRAGSRACWRRGRASGVASLLAPRAGERETRARRWSP